MSTTIQPRAVAADAGAPQRAGVREWTALAVLLLPVLLVVVDATVLSFALPSISVALQPSGTQLLWMIDIYPLVLAGLLLSQFVPHSTRNYTERDKTTTTITTTTKSSTTSTNRKQK